MLRRSLLAAPVSLLVACKSADGGGKSAADGGNGPPVLEDARGARVYELRRPLMVDGAPIASDNYFCSVCVTDPAASAAFDGATFPTGWDVAPRRTLDVDEAILFDPVNSRGSPRTLDLIDSIPGDELRLGAQPLFGQIVGNVGVLVTMESSRRLTWHAGATVQELQGDGETYVLFDRVIETGVSPPESITLPSGWTHDSRVLDAPLVLEEVPRVVVFMQLANQHLWQRVRPPP